jgi:hypothetical protein
MVNPARPWSCCVTPAPLRHASSKTLEPTEWRLRLGWLLLPLVIGYASPIPAQDSTLVRLRHRADSLAREWRQANAVADVVDSLERERATSWRDTVSVGALRIVANPSPLPLRAAAARAWPVIDSLYGSAAQDLAHSPYIIRAIDPDTTVPRGTLHVGMEVPWNLSESALTLLLVSSVPMRDPDPALWNWLGGPVRPSVRGEQDRAGVYIQFVTAPSQAARDCFLGRLRGCRNALRLGAPGDLLDQAYPRAAERRSLVMTTFGDYFNHGASAVAFRSCASGGDVACSDLLRSLKPGVLPRPLGYDAYVTLVHAALRFGGREAYPRLLANPAAAIPDRLAAAANMSIDSLLSRWRTEIIAARPVPVEMPSWALVVALGWMMFFAGCGLRSSRWRVG